MSNVSPGLKEKELTFCKRTAKTIEEMKYKTVVTILRWNELLWDLDFLK